VAGCAGGEWELAINSPFDFFLSFIDETHFSPIAIGIAFFILPFISCSQTDSFYLLKPDRVFDGETMHTGWVVGIDPEPQSVTNKRKSFAAALKAGVIICIGGDVGVYAHGDNAREMEMMADYGMKPIDVLKSSTSINADVFSYRNEIGRIRRICLQILLLWLAILQ